MVQTIGTDIHRTSCESRNFRLRGDLLIIDDVFNALDGGMWWEISAKCLVIIAESLVNAVLPSHLCHYVSHRISDITIIKYRGRSGVIRVLSGWGWLAIVDVDTVYFPEISSISLKVPIHLILVRLLQ